MKVIMNANPIKAFNHTDEKESKELKLIPMIWSHGYSVHRHA